MAQIFPKDDHDTVVRKFADLIQKNNPDKYLVITALDDTAEMIGGHVPDIVLSNPETKQPVLIIEVETTDSVSEQWAEERWLPIFKTATALQIIIPKGVASRVKRYCKRLGIKATFQEY